MFIYQDLKRIDYAEALEIQTAAFNELLAEKVASADSFFASITLSSPSANTD